MANVTPNVPESASDLNRAVHLLNLRMQSILGKEEQAEIKDLVGLCPTPAQAIAWKQAFKRKIAHLVVQG